MSFHQSHKQYCCWVRLLETIRLLEKHSCSLFLKTCLSDWTRTFLFVCLISQRTLFLTTFNMLLVFLNILNWKQWQCQVFCPQRQSSWLHCFILIWLGAQEYTGIKTHVTHAVEECEDMVWWSLPIAAVPVNSCFVPWNEVFVRESENLYKYLNFFC